MKPEDEDEFEKLANMFDPPLYLWIFWFSLILVVLTSLVLSAGG